MYTLKVCRLCDRILPMEEFQVSQRRGDGSGIPKTECRDCANARRHQWERANRERRNEYMRQYRKKKKKKRGQ